MASRPFGTEAVTLTGAASRGWSLAGNQVAAASGWPATIAPSSGGVKPGRPGGGVPEGWRHAVVGDDGGERGAVGQHVLRGDGQLLPVAAPGRVVVVDG